MRGTLTGAARAAAQAERRRACSRTAFTAHCRGRVGSRLTTEATTPRTPRGRVT